MVLYEDTRQKIGKHNNIKKQCDKAGIEIVRQVQKVGDYVLQGFDGVAIDTKKDLLELAKDFSSSDKSRFYRNFKNSIKYNIKLFILIEQGNYIKNISEVSNWNNPLENKIRYAITGRALMEKIYQAHISFGVEFLFCDKRNTLKTMLEIFDKYGVKNG